MNKIPVLLLVCALNLWSTPLTLTDTISTDITLQDTVLLDSLIFVNNGAVITLLPGTTVITAKEGAGIITKDGALLSLGTKSSPVSFVVAPSIQNSSGIIIEKSTTPALPDSRFEHTRFSGMMIALGALGTEDDTIHLSLTNTVFDSCTISSIFCQYASIVIDSSTFTNCIGDSLSTPSKGAIHAVSSSVTISNSTFTNNQSGALSLEDLKT